MVKKFMLVFVLAGISQAQARISLGTMELFCSALGGKPQWMDSATVYLPTPSSPSTLSVETSTILFFGYNVHTSTSMNVSPGTPAQPGSFPRFNLNAAEKAVKWSHLAAYSTRFSKNPEAIDANRKDYEARFAQYKESVRAAMAQSGVAENKIRIFTDEFTINTSQTLLAWAGEQAERLVVTVSGKRQEMRTLRSEAIKSCSAQIDQALGRYSDHPTCADVRSNREKYESEGRHAYNQCPMSVSNPIGAASSDVIKACCLTGESDLDRGFKNYLEARKASCVNTSVTLNVHKMISDYKLEPVLAAIRAILPTCEEQPNSNL